MWCACTDLERSVWLGDGMARESASVDSEHGKQRDLGSNPLRLSFPLESCGLWTLFCDFVPHI